MHGRRWYLLWIIAIVVIVLLAAGLLLIFQLGILDWTLWFTELEGWK